MVWSHWSYYDGKSSAHELVLREVWSVLHIQIYSNIYLQKDRGVGIPSLLTPRTQKKELDFCTEYHGYLPDASFHLAPHVKQS